MKLKKIKKKENFPLPRTWGFVGSFNRAWLGKWPLLLKKAKLSERNHLLTRGKSKKQINLVLGWLMVGLASFNFQCSSENSVGGKSFTCPNGTPQAGTTAEEDTVKCIACNSGIGSNAHPEYELTNGTCVQVFPFTCPNGAAEVGFTEEPNTLKCMSCSVGFDNGGTIHSPEYILDGSNCRQRFNHACLNGIALAGFTDRAATTQCTGCDVGFYLDVAECKRSASKWSSVANLALNNLFGVTYGNGLYVAVGAFGTILTSSGAISWDLLPSITNHALLAIVFGNKRFVALDDQGLFHSSLDTRTWTKRTPKGDYQLSGIIFGKGFFVAVGANGIVLTSSQGTKWALRNSGTTENLSRVAYNDNYYVTVGANGTILTSEFGYTWTMRDSKTENSLYSLAYGNGHFTVIGDNETILTSPDGVTWTSQKNAPTAFKSISFGNGIFLAIGQNSKIYFSPDGIEWTTGRSKVTSILRAIGYGNDTYISVGDTGTILTAQ